MLVNRSTVLLFVLCFACGTDNNQANVAKQNNEKFSNHEQKEARFLVDIVDTSYGILSVAQFGENKTSDAQQKEQLQRFIQSQTSALMKIKAFAESNGIALQFSDPSDGKGSLRKIERKGDKEFEKAWLRELKKLQHELKTDIEGYRRNVNPTDTSIINVLDTALIMVRQNNAIIESLEAQKESI